MKGKLLAAAIRRLVGRTACTAGAPTPRRRHELPRSAGFQVTGFQTCGLHAGQKRAGYFFATLATLSLLPLGAKAQEFKIITLDPGHFHAALFQREMLPGVAETVSVYAPLGPDLTAHLNRIAQFNQRRENPTSWRLEISTGPDCVERMLTERRGNVVVLSGNNQHKIDRLAASVRAGLHVLADKPWIIEPEAWPKLQAALETARQNCVIAYDAMTERFEISCVLQRELVNDRAVFGDMLTGTPTEPAVHLRSLHYLLKEVAGAPILRPVWFFDIRQQGEGLADVGTHLVEHAQWTLFPDQPIDYRRDLQVLSGSRWPTVLSREQFQQMTGATEFPDFLQPAVRSNRLEYFCNNSVRYTLRGVHVTIEVRWEATAPPGGKDTQWAVFRGSKARVELRRDQDQQFQPEVFVVPVAGALPEVRDALRRRIAALQAGHPGLGWEERVGELRVVIPEALRASHEAHFTKLCRRFLAYARDPDSLPAWEKPNLLAKYYVTTQGIARARRPADRPSVY